MVRAADGDVTITCEKKRVDHGPAAAQKPSQEVKKTENWGYTVTVENEAFKALQNLQVKYVIYYKQEKLGIKAPPRKQTKTGTFTIDSVDSLGKTSFDTVSVPLTRAVLVGSDVGGYDYFPNGAKPTAEDTLTGIWIRIYKDGSQFAEFAYPAGLTSSEQWKDN